MVHPDTIVTCYGCRQKVRARVTLMQATGEDGFMERWCLECLAAVDDTSKNIAPKPSPDNLPSDNLDDPTIEGN